MDSINKFISTVGKIQEGISTFSDIGSKAADFVGKQVNEIDQKGILPGETHKQNLSTTSLFCSGLKHIFQAIGKAVTFDIAGAIEEGQAGRKDFEAMKDSATKANTKNGQITPKIVPSTQESVTRIQCCLPAAA